MMPLAQKSLGKKMVHTDKKKEPKTAEIYLDEFKTSVIVSCENIELSFLTKEPSYSSIRISHKNLPDVVIKHDDWAALFAVMSGLASVSQWMNIKDGLAEK
jgi:hypothetical protein